MEVCHGPNWGCSAKEKKIKHAICAVRKDVEVVLLTVLLSAICRGYIIIYYLLYFAFCVFLC
jgi:hypothetical protein